MSSFWTAVGVVFRKESIDGLRDKRSIFSALLFPLLMPLLMASLFGAIAKNQQHSDQLEIPVVNSEKAPALINWLKQQGVGITQGPDNGVEAVRQGKSDFVVVITADFEQDLQEGRRATVELISDGSRNEVRGKVRQTRELIRGYGRLIGKLRLIARGVSPDISPAIIVEEVEVASARKRAGTLLGFIPMIVVLAAFIGGMQIAVDTTAGERERGSLEPLLLNPVPRTSLVLGKWLVASLFSGVGVVLALISFSVVLQRVPLEELGVRFELGPTEIAGVLAATLPLSLLSASMQVLVASFARSFKEAQSYLQQLMFLPMAPAITAVIYPIDSKAWMSPIPILGQHVLLTDVIGGEPASLWLFAVAGLSSLVISLACVWTTARLFRRESIIFGH